MQNKFSKFIKVLLGILAVLCIALVIVVIVHIKSNLPLDTITDQDYDELAKQVQQKQAEGLEKNNSDEVKSETYLYKNHGFQIELPKGFVPNEMESEGGPYLFIQLPDGGSIIQVGNVGFVKDLGGYCKAIQGGGDSIISKTPVIFGSSPFYLHTCEMEEFYVFEQGNVAYVFRMGNYDAHATDIIKTFKFVGWK